MASTVESNKTERRQGFRPEPIKMGPPFQWPLRPVVLLKWFFGFPGYLFPWAVLFMSTSLAWWVFLTPDMQRMKSLSFDWIAFLFVCNLALLVVYNSLWHVWLYIRKTQGTDYKYNSKWLATDDPTFVFGNQLWDNVLWNLCSAVPIWTAYQVLTFWLQANGFVPTVDWQAHPIYCVLLLLLTPIWINLHFYVTHRLIHWQPLYRHVHSLHHKNVNVGPWSGLAMHPIEHLVYFSGVLLFWLIPSHPLHVLYALQSYALGPAPQHLGFDRVVLGKDVTFNTDHYMHYLHHKHVKVNFGTGLVPLDKWLGTFHDGSDEAQEALKRRVRAQMLRARQARNDITG